ncbi:MAG: GTPase Era [Candidatus Giovannonibacteria bacterium GW2011_GWA2_53_7]|uniref:GTPase Era n=1 Tax=Candidatus Giovannonibacteria bacterium GW2011_GWA2_53_7 TaxID=1618650 RepID=A0A0G1XZU9_9BACT|nr:MAG: GTPase Era [Candidatus Giovannonibacteria bacterium GW2011_GWA2_53_7]
MSDATPQQNSTEAIPTKGKSGFAVLVGRSNVGKSTLLNALVGTKVAITSPKPQTTRLPVHGILTTEQGQIVFVDTPGIFQERRGSLGGRLLSSVKHSLRDVDAIVYVVDPTRSIGDEEKTVMRLIADIEKPKILVINKMDIREKPFVDFYRDLAPKFSTMIELSALDGAHVRTLTQIIYDFLPVGDPYYPDYQYTNQPNKDWIAEIIREKLFLRLHQELPYNVHVEVDDIQERSNGMLYIAATVYTTTERAQRIVIGQGARGIKEIGQSARKELEGVMEKKIYLDLNVSVDPSWTRKIG